LCHTLCAFGFWIVVMEFLCDAETCFLLGMIKRLHRGVANCLCNADLGWCYQWLGILFLSSRIPVVTGNLSRTRLKILRGWRLNRTLTRVWIVHKHSSPNAVKTHQRGNSTHHWWKVYPHLRQGQRVATSQRISPYDCSKQSVAWIWFIRAYFGGWLLIITTLVQINRRESPLTIEDAWTSVLESQCKEWRFFSKSPKNCVWSGIYQRGASKGVAYPRVKLRLVGAFGLVRATASPPVSYSPPSFRSIYSQGTGLKATRNSSYLAEKRS